MSDLIDRQAAIDAVRATLLAWSYMPEWRDKKIIEAVKRLPPIQPDIVRCAECKWFQCNMRFDGYLPEGVDEFECRHWHGSCDPTDFCSQGTRREVTT